MRSEQNLESKKMESGEEEPKYISPKPSMPSIPFPQRFQKVKLDA